MQKSTDVFYNRQGILIAAIWRDTTGAWSGGGDPMKLLPVDASTGDIGENVLRSIEASQDGLTAEKVQQACVRMFRLARVSGWDAMERRWDCIRAHIEERDRTIVVQPMHRHEAGGYVFFDDDPTYRCADDAENVGRVIRQLIDEPAQHVIRQEPSHT